jgi:hypothetical protein
MVRYLEPKSPRICTCTLSYMYNVHVHVHVQCTTTLASFPAISSCILKFLCLGAWANIFQEAHFDSITFIVCPIRLLFPSRFPILREARELGLVCLLLTAFTVTVLLVEYEILGKGGH